MIARGASRGRIARSAVLLAAGLALQLAARDGGAEPARGCPIPDDLEVVRVDDRNRRLFVIATAREVETRRLVERTLARSAGYIGSCHPDWADRWSVTLMAERRFAGYKTEPEILPYVKDGSWSKGYLAEYDRRRSILVRFPLIPARRVELEIRLGSIDRAGE